MAGAGSELENSGMIDGGVTFDANETMLDSGSIIGTVTASASDTLGYSGLFGEQSINNFNVADDVIQFAANDFQNFAQVQNAMSSF